MEKITLITGAPGSGKTQTFIRNLAKTNPDKHIWVLEPVKTIVDEKNTKNLDDNIKNLNKNDRDEVLFNITFINYAKGFLISFLPNYDPNKDIIIIDEAHTFFYTEFRNFDIKELKSFLEFYKNVYLITATPKILCSYLIGNKIKYDTVELPQRLKRENIVVNIIPTTFLKYVSKEKLVNCDITLCNNITAIKKIQDQLLNDETDFSYIYSVYNEFNNVLFEKKKTLQNKWIGTSSVGQGINKENTIVPNNGKVLINGNSFMTFPDDSRKYYVGLDKKKLKEKDNIKRNRTRFTNLVENIIQADRFRCDLDTFEIDVTVNIELNEIPLLEEIIKDYVNSVYKTNLKINIGDGLHANKLKNFGIKDFEKCFKTYNPSHTFNQKSYVERIHELLNVMCNPVQDGERVWKIGNFKSTLQYMLLIVEKFYLSNNVEIDYEDKHSFLFKYDNDLQKRFNYLQKGIVKFLKYLMDNNLKETTLSYLTTKKYDLGKKPKDMHHELHLQLDYLGESLLEIIFAHFGLKYNIENKRDSSPIQLISKVLRKLLLVADIDISGAHIVALVKKILGDDVIVTKEMIDKIYSYNIGKDRIFEQLSTFKKVKDISKEQYETVFNGERGVSKNTLLWSLNKFQYAKDKNDKNVIYVIDVLSVVFPEIKNKYIENYSGLGYFNGVKYEEKWLGDYNIYRGDFFRIADGICQIYGNKVRLEEIKNDIIKKHKIPLTDEPLSKYGDIPNIDKNLDYFIQDVYKNETDFDFINDFKDLLKELEKFRKYVRKGRTVGKTKGKAVHLKTYEIIKDFTVRITGISYKAGEYKWERIPIDIPAKYRQNYLKKKELIK